MNDGVAYPSSLERFGKLTTPATAANRLCVLQIIPSLDAGGAERACLDMAAAIHASGGVALVASQGGRLQAELAGLLITLPVASKNPLTIVINGFRLAWLVRKFNVDILHVRSRAPAWSVWIASALTGVPWLSTFHGFYSAGNLFKRFYNAIMLRGRRVIAGSDFMAAHITHTYDPPEGRIVTIARGIDMRRFDRDAIDASRVKALRQQLAIPDGAVVVLLPARLTRWKGQLLFAGALAMLDRRDVIGVMAGDAQGRDEYQQEILVLARRLGISDRVRVAGNVSDMPAAYCLADVVVSASLDAEAFGRVPVEAMAMGCSVIAADHGGASETMRPVGGGPPLGYVFTPGDVTSLHAALQMALATDVVQAAQHKRAARAHVSENYSTEVMCARTLALYREIMAEQ